MGPVFVNLPLGYAYGPYPYLEQFLENGISPEVGLDNTDPLDPATNLRCRDFARALKGAGLPCTVHLPFTSFEPARPGGATREKPGSGMVPYLELASLFDPVRLVGHPYLHVNLDQGNRAASLALNAEVWREALAEWPDHPPLCLENTFEETPDPLRDLVDELDGEGVGACFDVGHWHGFVGGAVKKDLARWIATLGLRILHLHLHDNDGTFDQHLGMGLGGVPWAELFDLLKRHGLDPTVTLEPHTPEDFQASRRFMADNPQWFG